ncbi:MAG: tetratricopeptide repeat protein [Marinoscillum sp.]
MRFSTVILAVLVLASCGGDKNNKADQFYKKGQYEEAVEAYNKTIETNPTDITSLYNRGRAHEELDHFTEAEQDFLKILEIDPKHLNANLSLSKLYYRQESYSKAVIFADRALELNENSAQGHFLVARAKHQLGYVDSALESYSLAININREYGEAYLYRGALRVHKKQSKSACEDFAKAVNLDVAEAKAIQKKYCK